MWDAYDRFWMTVDEFSSQNSNYSGYSDASAVDHSEIFCDKSCQLPDIIEKEFDSYRLRRKLTRRDFNSSEVYQIDIANLCFWATKDPNFLVRLKESQLVELDNS